MDWLPFLARDGTTAWLPCAPGTARVLARGMVSHWCSEDRGSLGRALLCDPWTTLWLVESLGPPAPKLLSEVAQRVTNDLLGEALDAPATTHPPVATRAVRAALPQFAYEAAARAWSEVDTWREALEHPHLLAWQCQLAGTRQRAWMPHSDRSPSGCSAWESRDLELSRFAIRWRAAIRRAWRGSPADSPPRLRQLALRLSSLTHLEREFDRTLRDEKLAAMVELAYGASHEINNPLTNIATRAQLLLKSEQRPGERKSLATIVDQAFRAFDMIADLMLFAKPPRMRRERFALDPFLKELETTLQHEAALRIPGTRIAIHRARAAGWLDADRAQLMVALLAMGRNSLQAMQRPGTLEIECRQARTPSGRVALELVVRDDGPGIPPDQLPRIFDPFYSGREAGRGLGFGLSKAWRIVREHGGQISVISSPGQGATFTITLPDLTLRNSRADVA